MKKILIGLLMSLFVLSANADHEKIVGELYQLELPAFVRYTTRYTDIYRSLQFKTISSIIR